MNRRTFLQIPVADTFYIGEPERDDEPCSKWYDGYESFDTTPSPEAIAANEDWKLRRKNDWFLAGNRSGQSEAEINRVMNEIWADTDV